MSVSCAACHTPLPIGADRAGALVRCPWCGASFVVSALAPAARRGDRGQVGGMVAVGAVLGLMLVLLLGLLWHLASGRSDHQLEPEVAAASPSRPAKADPEEEAPPPASAEATKPKDRDEAAAAPDGPLDDPTRPRATRGPAPPLMAVPRFATFMGARAAGRRFCIIADASGSMSMNNRMGRLKDELKKTLRDLADDQEVHVMFFESVTDPMPVAGWLRGGKDSERILPWIDRQTPRGGTEPLDAFGRAFALEPRPDAIFFMTDGLIPPNVPDAVARLNSKGAARVPINTILFGGEASPANLAGMNDALRKRMIEQMARMHKQAELLLERMARDSGGSHRFVPDRVAEAK
jgi:hypothetical protein